MNQSTIEGPSKDVLYQSIKRCVEHIVYNNLKKDIEIFDTNQENCIYEMLRFVLQTRYDMSVSFQLPQTQQDEYSKFLRWVDLDYPRCAEERRQREENIQRSNPNLRF